MHGHPHAAAPRRDTRLRAARANGREAPGGRRPHKFPGPGPARGEERRGGELGRRAPPGRRRSGEACVRRARPHAERERETRRAGARERERRQRASEPRPLASPPRRRAPEGRGASGKGRPAEGSQNGSWKEVCNEDERDGLT